MKIVKKFSLNQKGMSLVTVVASIALGIGAITYVIKDALPKLQSEKKKIDAQLSYRILMSSINDYLVHGIREKWCINWEKDGVTDLLESNKCVNSPMEDVVTYPGNLERVLWGADTIGTKLTSAPAPESANRILALNFLRHKNGKTSKVLDYDDVAPKDGKLTFKITKAKLDEMNDNHPLYIMSRKVMDCINSIDIEVFQVKDFTNLASGDEKKVGIKISTDIAKSKLSCLAVQTAESISFYTFYPRRLHTFSLIKYGDLDGNRYNEFHGPVYVAGHFILPPADANKETSTVFYNTLTLGVHNGGSAGKRYQGRIVENGKVFSFAERGHPYLSKQDQYKGFRGFLGGLRTDSSEDKGFYNLFDHTAVSNVDMAQLEACIDDNQTILNKSKNASSKLLYQTVSKNSSSVKVQFSFDQKNRFASNGDRPRVIASASGGKSNESYFNIDVKDFKEVEAIGEIRFLVEDKGMGSIKAVENYQASIGDNSRIVFEPNFEKHKVTVKHLDSYLSNLKDVTYTNFNQAIESKVIRNNSIYDQFDKAAKAFIAKCENKLAVNCATLGYKPPVCGTEPVKPGPGKPPVNNPGKGDNENSLNNIVEEEEEEEQVADVDNYQIATACSTDLYQMEKNKYQQARDALISYVNLLRDRQVSNDTSLEIRLEQVPQIQNKTVLNQRYVQFYFSQGWQDYFQLTYDDLETFDISFVPYHYGKVGSQLLRTTFMSSQHGNNLRVIRTTNNNSVMMDDLKDSWTTTNNEHIQDTPTPLLSLDCPQGMGIADWDLDMSKSSNFSWNYANTPAGAKVDSNDHEQAPPIIFHPGNPPLEGHAYSSTKSVVQECIIPADRTHVYGFYVCNKITIKDRNLPLYMVGTFITKDLAIPKNLKAPIHWLSIWDTKATDLIMTDLSSMKSACNSIGDLTSKTWKDIVIKPQIAATVDACGPLDLVTNGPNNFSWTTVDPDVGIANASDVMTSQKVNRIQKWIIREESRTDLIR